MAINDCIDRIKAEVPDLTDDEVDFLISELRRERRKPGRQTDISALEDEAVAAADRVVDRLKAAAYIEKRNSALNRLALMKGMQRVRQFHKPAEGVYALIAGSERLRTGSRDSASANQRQFIGAWTGGLISDMERAGLHELFISNSMSRETANALWLIDDPSRKAELDALPRQAVKMAQIIRKYQETARLTQNRFGAWIGKIPGYITRQGHDMFKIRAAGLDEFKRTIEDKLDWDQIGRDNPDLDRDQFLRSVWNNLSSGVHIRAQTDAKQAAFKGPLNLARRASKERVLHFKDANAWFDYNQVFGVGPLSDSILFGLNRAGRTAGLMKVLGTNPEQTIRVIFDQIGRELHGNAKPADAAAFQEGMGKAIELLHHADGTADIPGNRMGAKVTAGVMAVESMAKLGGAVVSAITDIPMYAADVKYSTGQGFLSGIHQAIAGLINGKPHGEQRELLSTLGVFFDSMAQGALARFDMQDLTGRTGSWLLTKFFKWNGLTWWTETLRSSHALMHSHHLALQRDKGWLDLDEPVRRSLTLYGANETTWNLMRQGHVLLADGRPYMTPESMDLIPNEAVEIYLAGQGRTNITPQAIQNTKDDLGSMLRTFFTDRATHAVIEPDIRTRRWLLRGTKPGTLPGGLLRLLAQFKGFPVAVLQKSIGRELFGKGSDTLGQALKNGNGELLGVAQLMLWTTLFGYGAMSAKDLLKGRTPRNPLDYKTWLAAMLQGGALGIYGDFLLGQSNRFGKSLTETIAGPTIGLVADVDELRARLMAGDDVAASAFKTLINNTPYLNLFYLRIVLDYAFLYQLQEWMNPGYLRRMERRAKKENNQEFWLKPSEVAQ